MSQEKPKVCEVISFGHELDLLEAHIIESLNWVDKIYLIESDKWFTGLSKPRYFWENRKRFEQYEIEYLNTPGSVFISTPKTYEVEDNLKWMRVRRDNRNMNRIYHWNTVRDKFQYVYMNDVDEFVHSDYGEEVRQLLDGNNLYLSIKTARFSYYMNYLDAIQEQWRITRSDLPDFRLKKGTVRSSTTNVVGWHFTNCFKNVKDQQRKLFGISCHLGTAYGDVPTLEGIQKSIDSNHHAIVGDDIQTPKTRVVQTKDLFWTPKFVERNPELFPWSDKPAEVIWSLELHERYNLKL